MPGRPRPATGPAASRLGWSARSSRCCGRCGHSVRDMSRCPAIVGVVTGTPPGWPVALVDRGVRDRPGDRRWGGHRRGVVKRHRGHVAAGRAPQRPPTVTGRAVLMVVHHRAAPRAPPSPSPGRRPRGRPAGGRADPARRSAGASPAAWNEATAPRAAGSSRRTFGRTPTPGAQRSGRTGRLSAAPDASSGPPVGRDPPDPPLPQPARPRPPPRHVARPALPPRTARSAPPRCRGCCVRR